MSQQVSNEAGSSNQNKNVKFMIHVDIPASLFGKPWPVLYDIIATELLNITDRFINDVKAEYDARDKKELE